MCFSDRWQEQRWTTLITSHINHQPLPPQPIQLNTRGSHVVFFRRLPNALFFPPARSTITGLAANEEVACVEELGDCESGRRLNDVAVIVLIIFL